MLSEEEERKRLSVSTTSSLFSLFNSESDPLIENKYIVRMWIWCTFFIGINLRISINYSAKPVSIIIG